VGALILDASVLIGLLDRRDAHHERAVRDAEAADLAARAVLTPASAYSEALVAFGRARELPSAVTAIAAMGVTVVPLTAAIAELAVGLRARHARLLLADAVVLATARELGGELLSYDRVLSSIARRSAR
jgi:predicted nucleic acid-binding protein